MRKIRTYGSVRGKPTRQPISYAEVDFMLYRLEGQRKNEIRNRCLSLFSPWAKLLLELDSSPLGQ